MAPQRTCLLGIFGTRAHRVRGTGSNEYKPIRGAAIRLFGLIDGHRIGVYYA